MEKPKLYCPFCSLVLNGDTHQDDNEAWVVFNCEYNKSLQEDKPITEIAIKQEVLQRLTARKNEINRGIRSLRHRIEELKIYK